MLSLQGTTPGQGLPRRVIQYHTEGVEAHDELGPLLHRLTHALGMGIAAIRHGDIACLQREMLARFARVDIADEHLDQLQGPEVHRDMEAMVCGFGSWGLNTAGVDAHKAQPCGQCIHGGHGEHLPQQSFDPWTTGAQALRHRLVCNGLIQGRKGAGHLAQGCVQATL